MPCSNCFKRKKVCRMIEASSRCGECVKLGRSCDGVEVVSQLKRSVAEERRLENELASSELALQEALAKVSRLRRQRQVARVKSQRLFRRGVRDLDEQDGIRTQEEAILEEQQAVGTAQSLGAVGIIDWTSILPDFSDPAFFPDVAGGTVGQASGSSSGV
ncbi:unnamed protein product [Clonostachys chloroleuca]|uniref:Zn(2)-C6 fungal-type domain-containing protein n=1 Tax=Clonostachys chloroleuca TaxID=1926264 RepID=A0AA35M871_9HYPO|nr:unnamed protein product [Clonostachys chloroleuca]